MTERLIDAVCPHCGRLGTTVRVVKHEDGFTKLSRLCKECGGEWIHTFDADWLAVAKMRRLEAEVERLRAEIDEARAEVERMQELLRGISINMVDLIEQLTRERDEARAEVERLRAALRQGFPIRYETSAGCLCPANANLHCQNSFCPRRNPPGVTCYGGKP